MHPEFHLFFWACLPGHGGDPQRPESPLQATLNLGGRHQKFQRPVPRSGPPPAMLNFSTFWKS